MSDGLSQSWSNALSDKQRGAYRRLLGLVLILDVAIGLALVAAPRWTMRLLETGDPASADWARIAGLLWLLVAALLWTGRHHPNRAKTVNLIGLAGRFALGAALMLIGGRLLWLGLVEAVAALVLLRCYYNVFSAMVMSRP